MCWENAAGGQGASFSTLTLACIIQSARSSGRRINFEYVSALGDVQVNFTQQTDVHVNYPDQFSADVIPRESIKGDVTFMDGGCDACCHCCCWEDSLFSHVSCGIAQKRKVASLLLRAQVLATDFHFCTWKWLMCVYVRLVIGTCSQSAPWDSQRNALLRGIEAWQCTNGQIRTTRLAGSLLCFTKWVWRLISSYQKWAGLTKFIQYKYFPNIG